MKIVEAFIGMLKFRYKLYFSILRSFFENGSFVYDINNNVKFVCTIKDYFSKIIFISGGHEKLEMKWCEKWLQNFNHIKIIDCGANIGYFSAYLAQVFPNSKITAVEGNKKTFDIFKHILDKLQLKNITPYNRILAETSNEYYEIPDIPGREPWQQAQKITSENYIKTLTLDSLTLENKEVPTLIKIDCEGFEVKILKGASELLSKRETTFMVECNDAALIAAGNGRKELFNLFKENNYKLYLISAFDKFLPIGEVITDDFPSKEFNFVAIPDKPSFMNLGKAVLEDIQRDEF